MGDGEEMLLHCPLCGEPMELCGADPTLRTPAYWWCEECAALEDCDDDEDEAENETQA